MHSKCYKLILIFRKTNEHDLTLCNRWLCQYMTNLWIYRITTVFTFMTVGMSVQLEPKIKTIGVNETRCLYNFRSDIFRKGIKMLSVLKVYWRTERKMLVNYILNGLRWLSFCYCVNRNFGIRFALFEQCAACVCHRK